MSTMLDLQERINRVKNLIGAIGFTLEFLGDDGFRKALSELVQVTEEAIDAANESLHRLKTAHEHANGN